MAEIKLPTPVMTAELAEAVQIAIQLQLDAIPKMMPSLPSPSLTRAVTDAVNTQAFENLSKEWTKSITFPSHSKLNQLPVPANLEGITMQSNEPYGTVQGVEAAIKDAAKKAAAADPARYEQADSVGILQPLHSAASSPKVKVKWVLKGGAGHDRLRNNASLPQRHLACRDSLPTTGSIRSSTRSLTRSARP